MISFVCAAVAGVQVFNLTKSLPAKPYGQSGPKLLTRNTTRRAWKATFDLMRNGTERVAMLGVPGIGKSRNLALGLWHLVTGQLPGGIPQPEAIVFEARQSRKVFLFTKGQGGEWKAQSQSMRTWDAAACPHLQNSKNWYLVDAFKADNPIMLAAKTLIACSPDRNHYSDFVKDGTRLFTYLSADGISKQVSVCSPGAAAMLVERHYDQLVPLWSDAGNPKSRYGLEDCVGPLLTTFWPGKQGFTACEVTNAAPPAAKRAQWNRTPVNDFQVKKGLQLECDTEKIFDDRWREAVQIGSLDGRVLHSPENYPGIDYLLDFNHGISVTTSLTHDIAKAFREKLKNMFNAQPCSFTLTFLITGDPQKFAPEGEDFNELQKLAGPSKTFHKVCVQVVQVPKTLNSLS